jgi:tagatose-1,6-bisphosphate aldolase non-catalytic subunit AgaZ/GatZ
MSNRINEFVNTTLNSELTETLYICKSKTECAKVLADTFEMFGEELNWKTYFKTCTASSSVQLQLSYQDLVDFVYMSLNLDANFKEEAYLKYIVRKIFARYQSAGKLKIELCTEETIINN